MFKKNLIIFVLAFCGFTSSAMADLIMPPVRRIPVRRPIIDGQQKPVMIQDSSDENIPVEDQKVSDEVLNVENMQGQLPTNQHIQRKRLKYKRPVEIAPDIIQSDEIKEENTEK